MHSFDLPSRSPYPRRIPAMRPSREPPGASGTPIYDALYSEYQRLFRTLPGDRSGEEELRFDGFRGGPAERPAPPPAGRHRGGLPALPPGGRPLPNQAPPEDRPRGL
ncbi:hypothetical protein [Streptomyces sp. HB2AG]|uniref:hypothetical protein n=1 Tax=Streptomyces sp. HB2AG TaxID=2983400 RepID=UPI0022AA263B|nr:hypothetical protein [Streptomyces sp. HB2AG]MCZ2527456.1 hypothetical protein [Streptomyces sp. HB2AG]